MSDPRPLREGTTRLFDRSLLESAIEDRAPEGAEEKVLAALAVGTVGVGLGVAAAHGAGGTQAGAVASKIVSAAVLKWLGVGLVVTVAAAAPVTYFAVVKGAAPAPAASGLPVVGGARGGIAKGGPATASTSTSTSGDGDDEGEVMDVNALPAASAMPSAVARVAAAPVRSASSLSPELDVLDRARDALAAHDPAAARRALDEYRQRFPHGSLREEAELASIETLVQGGDSAAARDAAEAFLAAHPSSPYVGRARAILKRVSNP